MSVRPLGDILEGTLVNLTCTVDANPPAENYTWFKGNTLLGQGKIYSFSKINATDSGVYKCQCWNKLGTANSTNVTLDVLCKFHHLPIFVLVWSTQVTDEKTILCILLQILQGMFRCPWVLLVTYLKAVWWIWPALEMPIRRTRTTPGSREKPFSVEDKSIAF